MDGLKTCRRCEVAKAAEEFRPQRGTCRPCERAEKNAARAQLDRAPVVGVLKTCSKCGEEKACEEFSTDKRASDGRFGWCNPCARTKASQRRVERPELHRAAVKKYKSTPIGAQKAAESIKKWHAENPDSHIRSVRKWHLKTRYAITPEHYDELLVRQHGKCAICGFDKAGTAGYPLLAVDHIDTPDGPRVRGLLCSNCNTAIGLLKDDPDRMFAAANYVLQSYDVVTPLLFDSRNEE